MTGVILPCSTLTAESVCFAGDYLMVDYRHIRGTSQSVNLAFQTAVT
ncbi:MAG: hypothetical protein R2860_03630 [Desulfobacterales bacterium]